MMPTAMTRGTTTSVRISHQDDDVNIYESGLDDEKESCRLVNIQVAIDL